MQHVLQSVVVGAGQAGLSTAHHLLRRGLSPWEDVVVLDANTAPGGAWQHRWDTLTMADVHGVSALPDDAPPPTSADRANAVVPAVFADYERRQGLPVIRPARVDRVEDDGAGLLRVSGDGDRTWTTRTLVNATGTWGRPFVPLHPGAGTFAGRQLHTQDYRGPAELVGQHVVVVGGGLSAVQILAELSEVATTTWVTRREPEWRTTRSRPRRVGPPSPWSRNGSARACHRRASSASPA